MSVNLVTNILILYPARAQDFSTKLVLSEKGMPAAAIHASNGRIRLDVPSRIGNDDLPRHQAFTLWYINGRIKPFPVQGEDDAEEIMGFVLIYLTFQPETNSGLCAQYISHFKKLERIAERGAAGEKENDHIACKDLGEDKIQGRQTQKLWVEEQESHQMLFTMWVDRRIHFVTKIVLPEAFLEVQDVREAAQPAGLFAVPPEAQDRT